MKLSVIIPTYNRADKLEKTLQCLHRQSLSGAAYDIWVVSDGSTDATKALLKKWTQKSKKVHALFQKNAGQGAARNHALKKITADVVLFMGDDIYASPDFLRAHLEFHQKHPQKNAACLGLTEWDPSKPVTPFMHWLTHGGHQFAYYRLAPNKPASFWYFYTSNISLKTALLKHNKFDEDFKGYGWEDMELGYRLHKENDLKLTYLPKALAYHDHPMEEKDLSRKMLQIGKTARVFQKKHPELRVLPRTFKKAIHGLIGRSAPLLNFLSPLIGKGPYWYALTKRYFLEGSNSL